MRTTIDMPDSLYRQLKARAALGRPVKDLVGMLLQRGLATTEAAASPARGRSALPTRAVASAFPLPAPSNAALFELLDEAPDGA